MGCLTLALLGVELRLAGRPSSSGAQACAGEDQIDEQYDDADDQQVKQAFDYDADDAEDDGRDDQEQE